MGILVWRRKMASMLKRLRESAMPTLKETKFQEKGVLTPEEFVAAGDMLVYKCPTWSWESGSNIRSFLPEDKQYLVTRNVPCAERVASIEYFDMNDELLEMDEGSDSDGWVATHMDLGAGGEQAAALQGMGMAGPSDTLGAYGEDDDAAAVAEEPDAILRTRTYDISITYDKYYQTPRVWLFGYDGTGQPLTQEEIFQDISQDHAKKTVTFEPHPHLGIAHASIHPCKHSNVMLRMIEHLGLSGQTIRADMYMFLFIKFVSTIIPTINYDHTVDWD